jgi:UDP-glucose 4-epimerase
MNLLITGGSGFFGTHLKHYLAKEGHRYVNLDLYDDQDDNERSRMYQCDLTEPAWVNGCFRKHGPFDAVIHVAAQLAHDVKNADYLWESNVTGTKHLAELAVRHHVPLLIFTSTNCLWGKPLNRNVVEDDPPCPVEIYGRSKLEAERVLRGVADRLKVIIFRSPTIIASGRVGLLGILFDLIIENKKIPVVGRDDKPYQFIHATDYANAIRLALGHASSDVFHVGSDDPTSLEATYRYVIERAGSTSRIYHLPKAPTILLMKLFHRLRLSPLGPYHYQMIAEEFVFDTSHLKKTLRWQPTKTNGEVLFEAFTYYRENRHLLERRESQLPAHKRRARMGLVDLLRWVP